LKILNYSCAEDPTNKFGTLLFTEQENAVALQEEGPIAIMHTGLADKCETAQREGSCFLELYIIRSCIGLILQLILLFASMIQYGEEDSST
jgi:hypothetical protein